MGFSTLDIWNTTINHEFWMGFSTKQIMNIPCIVNGIFHSRYMEYHYQPLILDGIFHEINQAIPFIVNGIFHWNKPWTFWGTPMAMEWKVLGNFYEDGHCTKTYVLCGEVTPGLIFPHDVRDEWWSWSTSWFFSIGRNIWVNIWLFSWEIWP